MGGGITLISKVRDKHSFLVYYDVGLNLSLCELSFEFGFFSPSSTMLGVKERGFTWRSKYGGEGRLVFLKLTHCALYIIIHIMG